MNEHVRQWYIDISRINGVNGRGRNKLRTYKMFKSVYEVETYCKMHMPYPHRSALSRFRCGVAPLRLETGRYENIPENDRVCLFCKGGIENEKHVLLECPMYESDRAVLINKANNLCDNYNTMSETDKLVFLFTNPDMIRVLAKTCCNILIKRNNVLYLR